LRASLRCHIDEYLPYCDSFAAYGEVISAFNLDNDPKTWHVLTTAAKRGYIKMIDKCWPRNCGDNLTEELLFIFASNNNVQGIEFIAKEMIEQCKSVGGPVYLYYEDVCFGRAINATTNQTIVKLLKKVRDYQL